MTHFIDWLRQQRSSTRFAFLLQVCSRLGTAVLALLWTRLLLEAMGEALNGQWIVFLGIISLAGLGDLGLGGVIAIRVTHFLAQRDDPGLARFLSSARALFTALALGTLALLLVLTPVLPGWLGFAALPGSGSLPLLFAVGAVSAALVVFNSYWSNLNYACGNITWPIVPGFLLTQLSLATHWLLARWDAPLWLQYVPYFCSALTMLFLIRFFLKVSHPSLAGFWPLSRDWSVWRTLTHQSFWIYFWSLGSVVYTTADRILINKGFGPEIIPTYHNNFKVCELALSFIVTATFVSMPKIARWIASPEAEEKTRGIVEILRLNRVQVFVTSACALVYLAVNDSFMRLWLGERFVAPLSWQLAFALSLVVTGSGDVATHVTPRCNERGIRYSGAALVVTALLNLGLSFWAMKVQWILGIALATVLAQSFFSFATSHFVCRHLGIPWGRWILRTWLMPVLVVAAGYGVRVWSADRTMGLVITGVVSLLLMLVVAWVTGMNAAFVREELRIVRQMLSRAGDKA